jgi:hypothetical protein
MARIRDANLETVTATCDACGASCVFNRVDDLRDAMPIAGKHVQCFSCDATFWINGDRITSTYEFLINDARENYAAKKYLPAVATLTQAWEVFFAACASSRYVFAPFFASPAHLRSTELLNEAHRELRREIAKFTWFPLRNLVINIILHEVAPATLVDARAAIREISIKRLGNDVSPDAVRAISLPRKRETIEALLGLTIGHLRNQAVHKFARRPRRSEVEQCLDAELDVLYRVKHRLGVGDFIEHQADAVFVDDEGMTA